MTIVTASRVAETSTTTGTGAMTVLGAISSDYVRFDSVMATSDVATIMIVAADGTWERALATYSGTDTLTRTVTLDSTTGSAINFAAGLKTIFLIEPDLDDYIANLTTDSSIAYNDLLYILDSAASNAPKQTTVEAFISPLNTSGWVLLGETTTGSGPTTIDFTGLTSTYDQYLFSLRAIKPGSDDDLGVRLETASAWNTGTNYHTAAWYNFTTTRTGFGGASQTGFLLTGTALAIASSASSPGLSGWFRLMYPADTVGFKRALWENVAEYTTSGLAQTRGGGAFNQTTAVTGVRFYFTGGSAFDSTQGSIQMYGLKGS